jgi:hypothetical protein
MASTAMTEREKRLMTTLEIILRYMQRFLSQSDEGRSNHFMAQANLLSGRIIQQLDAFSRGVKLFHDRTGQT